MPEARMMHHTIKQAAACQHQCVSTKGASGPSHDCCDHKEGANLLHKRTDSILSCAIGQELRAMRRNRRMTVSELARVTGLSISMVSRMENGTACPSINTLRLLSRALSAPLIAFFRSYEKESDVLFVKAKAEMEIACLHGSDTVKGLLLKHTPIAGDKLLIEQYHVVITPKSVLERDDPHNGARLIYILAGELIYRYGMRRFRLCSGDSLFFYAGMDHGPERVVSPIAHYLSVSSALRK